MYNEDFRSRDKKLGSFIERNWMWIILASIIIFWVSGGTKIPSGLDCGAGQIYYVITGQTMDVAGMQCKLVCKSKGMEYIHRTACVNGKIHCGCFGLGINTTRFQVNTTKLS